MKKRLIIIFALALLTSFVSAESSNWNFEIQAGYAKVSPEKINKNFDDLKTFTMTETKISDGFEANINVMYQALNFLKIGPRVGILKPSKGLMTTNFFELSYDPTLIPLELGVTFNIALKNIPFGIIVSGFGGYGIAVVNNTFTLGTNSISPVYSGGGPVFDFMAGVYITPVSLFEINAGVGYKIAVISELKANEAVSEGILSVDKGDTIKDITNATIPFDFSGFNFKLGLSFKF